MHTQWGAGGVAGSAARSQSSRMVIPRGGPACKGGPLCRLSQPKSATVTHPSS